jgi:DNA modification methylase
MFLPSDERIYWMYRDDDFTFHDTTLIKTWSTVWDVGLEPNREHAAGFPRDIPRRCVLACSDDGDTIADPYCGSGTTLVVAEETGRKCLGMEIDPGYADVIVRRWETLTGHKATLAQPSFVA